MTRKISRSYYTSPSDQFASLKQAQDELDVIVEVHAQIKTLLGAIKRWETCDNGILLRPEQASVDELERLMLGAQEDFQEALSTISTNMVRFRELANRYGVSVNANWLYWVPTAGRANPAGYQFLISPANEQSIMMELLMIRGAASQNVEREKQKAARPWLRKCYEDYLLQVANWFLRPEHSKYTLTVVLAVLAAVVVRVLGYDGRTIVDIVKALRGGKE